MGISDAVVGIAVVVAVAIAVAIVVAAAVDVLIVVAIVVLEAMGVAIAVAIVVVVGVVRLVGVGDCHVYAAFDANPGGFYSIRFADDGSVSIEEVEGMEGGPGLTERDGGPTDCE